MNQEQITRWRKMRSQLPVFVAVAAITGLVFVSIVIDDLLREEGKVGYWEWVGVLIIPVAITAGGIWLNNVQVRREEGLASQRAQDEALQRYLDQMSDLLIGQELRSKPRLSPERLLAQARTTTILLTLDKDRKRHPLKLVYRLRLIDRDEPLVDLENADLVGANLSEVKLSDAYLKGIDLRMANLQGSNLRGADLSSADLRGADLRDTDLSGTCLRGANLLPYDEEGPGKLSFHNLNGTDLSNAVLSGVRTKLSGANLSDADLSGAYLKGAIGVTKEELERQAKILDGVTMLDGSRYD